MRVSTCVQIACLRLCMCVNVHLCVLCVGSCVSKGALIGVRKERRICKTHMPARGSMRSGAVLQCLVGLFIPAHVGYSLTDPFSCTSASARAMCVQGMRQEPA